MGHITARRAVTRTGAAVCVAVGLGVLGGGGAGADPLPMPLDTAAAGLSAAVQPQAQDAASGPDRPQDPSPLRPLDGVTGRVDSLLPGGDGAGGDGTDGADQGSGVGSDQPAADGGHGQGNGQGGAQGQQGQQGQTAPAEGSPPQGDQPGTGARVTSDAVTACVIPTGSASPAVEFDLSVLGNDAGSPLAKAIPQVFTPCPEGAVPADTVAGADVDVEGLVGACVRVTREVAPLRTTLVVLDHDVIAALTDAGLPLEQLVVPCPAGASVPGAPTDPGPKGTTRSDRPASAVPSLPGRLAFTGADPVPLASLAVALLSLGAVLTRRARRLRPCASRG